MDYFTNQTQWPLTPTSHSHSPPAENGQQTAASLNGHPSSSIDPSASYNYGDLSVSSAPPSQFWSNPFYYYPGQPEYSIPVSSYSSLNGATSIASSSQPQLAIDPALSSPSTQLQNSDGVSNYASFNPTTEHSAPTLTVNPSLLHNPSPLPSSSRSNPKASLRDVLKPLLSAPKLNGASAVGIIVKVLDSNGYQNVDCETRTELFSKLSVHADDQFFKAWVDNTTAMDITRTWLKAGAADKLDGPWRPSINPILSALGRMRFTLESLKDAKLGKIILKLTKDPNSATRDLSQDLEAKWRRLLTVPGGTQIKSENSDDLKLKKRKAPDTVTSKTGPPAKRPAIAPIAPTKPIVKREPKVVVTAVKDAKSDSSFFSSKTKAKLPSFKKSAAPKPANGAPAKTNENISQPSSFDPFQDVLRSMKRTASPKVEARSATPLADTRITGQTPMAGAVKKKKSVTFAPDGLLEQVKYIEKAIYEDDLSIDMMHGMHSLRDLDRDEGAALHAHNIFEEQMDWADVLLVEISEAPLEERGSRSLESSAQEERETSALGAVYMFPSQIPESPSEPLQLPPEDPDAEVKYMVLGDALEKLMNNEEPNPGEGLSTLLASLPSQQQPDFLYNQSLLPPQATMAPQLTGGPDVNNVVSAFLQAVQQGNMGNLNSLMQQYPPTAADTSAWDGQQPQQYFQAGNTNHMQWETNDTGWNAGRGVNNNNGNSNNMGRGGLGGFRGKRKPCNYFAQGRCKYGDQCDFSHDLSS